MTASRNPFEPAIDLEPPPIHGVRSSPLPPEALVHGLRSLLALSLRGWLKTYHRLRIEGRENLPADGSFVMIANHTSHLDTLCLLSALPLRKLNHAYPAAAQDYFFVSQPRSALATIFMNALPFARRTGVRQSLGRCRRLLAQPGNIVILFPEGTRSTTGKMDAFRAGVGYLVLGSDVPVIPCALRGAGSAWPKGAMLPRPRGVHLVIGKPRVYSDLAPCRESADAVALDLHSAVEELLCH